MLNQPYGWANTIHTIRAMGESGGGLEPSAIARVLPGEFSRLRFSFVDFISL